MLLLLLVMLLLMRRVMKVRASKTAAAAAAKRIESRRSESRCSKQFACVTKQLQNRETTLRVIMFSPACPFRRCRFGGRPVNKNSNSSSGVISFDELGGNNLKERSSHASRERETLSTRTQTRIRGRHDQTATRPADRHPNRRCDWRLCRARRRSASLSRPIAQSTLRRPS